MVTYIIPGSKGGGCPHAAAPRGCGITQLRCACGWTWDRRCGNDPLYYAKRDSHQSECPRANDAVTAGG